MRKRIPMVLFILSAMLFVLLYNVYSGDRGKSDAEHQMTGFLGKNGTASHPPGIPFKVVIDPGHGGRIMVRPGPAEASRRILRCSWRSRLRSWRCRSRKSRCISLELKTNLYPRLTGKGRISPMNLERTCLFRFTAIRLRILAFLE